MPHALKRGSNNESENENAKRKRLENYVYMRSVLKKVLKCQGLHCDINETNCKSKTGNESMNYSASNQLILNSKQKFINRSKLTNTSTTPLSNQKTSISYASKRKTHNSEHDINKLCADNSGISKVDTEALTQNTSSHDTVLKSSCSSVVEICCESEHCFEHSCSSQNTSLSESSSESSINSQTDSSSSSSSTCSENEASVIMETRNGRNNNSIEEALSFPNDNYVSGKVIHVQGDGRCLFRSLVVDILEIFQNQSRDETGKLKKTELADNEKHLADQLRAHVVHLMKHNLRFYNELSKEVLNADQPYSTVFKNFMERLAHMSNVKAMPGELELNAAAFVLKRPILVLNSEMRKIVTFAFDAFPMEDIAVVRFTKLSEAIGHYDAVILTKHDVENCDRSNEDLSKSRSSTGFTSGKTKDKHKDTTDPGNASTAKEEKISNWSLHEINERQNSLNHGVSHSSVCACSCSDSNSNTETNNQSSKDAKLSHPSKSVSSVLTIIESDEDLSLEADNTTYQSKEKKLQKSLQIGKFQNKKPFTHTNTRNHLLNINQNLLVPRQSKNRMTTNISSRSDNKNSDVSNMKDVRYKLTRIGAKRVRAYNILQSISILSTNKHVNQNSLRDKTRAKNSECTPAHFPNEKLGLNSFNFRRCYICSGRVYKNSGFWLTCNFCKKSVHLFCLKKKSGLKHLEYTCKLCSVLSDENKLPLLRTVFYNN